MEIIHDKPERTFYVEVEGVRARLEYGLRDGVLEVLHTIVPGKIGGRGIAGALVSAAYDYAQSEHLRFKATCSYAQMWLKRYQEQHNTPL